jgi:hypothetical protein
MAFGQAFQARSLTIAFAAPCPSSQTVELQVSDDGKSFRSAVKLVFTTTQAWHPGWELRSFPPITSRLFRILFRESEPPHGRDGVSLTKLCLGHRYIPDNLPYKAGFDHTGNLEPNGSAAAPAHSIIDPRRSVDLTSQMDPSGKLNWPAPPGRWTVLRIGHTCNGTHSHQAPEEVSGLEIDKFSRAALDAFWPGFVGKLAQDAGRLIGNGFDNVLIDSYEVGSQNWTPKMRQEFRQRRGYDLWPFFPALTGRVVASPEQTERFLWDYRRTMADLVADNYYGYFRDLCHKNGLQLFAEPYGNGNFDDLQCGSRIDFDMGEFWINGWTLDSLKQASSVAHTLGRTVVGAESFTSSDSNWHVDLAAFKLVGDMAFCEGINRYMLHEMALQPWLDKFPGMTMGSCGTHFDRTQTWWEAGAGWTRYLSRCQYLLQQGKFVGDLCYFEGENSPAEFPGAGQLKPPVPSGYDYDGCTRDVLDQFFVSNGRMKLPGGMSYGVLVLPESKYMTPRVLRKVTSLIKAGGTVIGPKPCKSPSLENYPRCDEEVRRLAEAVWGDCDGQRVREHRFGKGKVIWGQAPAEVLKSLGVPPDFESTPSLRYIHRRNGRIEIYFLSNPGRMHTTVQCTFRVRGLQPELWDPKSGEITVAPVWSERDGRITLPLQFDAEGSLFVIFREPVKSQDHIVAVHPASENSLVTLPGDKPALRAFSADACEIVTAKGRRWNVDVTTVLAPIKMEGDWTVEFAPHWGAPGKVRMDHLVSWTQYSDEGIRYFSGTAEYTTQFTLPAEMRANSREFWLDLGEVKEFAIVTLNGQTFDPLWISPFRLNVTRALKTGQNVLRVKVSNLWDNRLIGDAQLPDDCEWAGQRVAGWPGWLENGQPRPNNNRLTFTTWRHYTKNSPLYPSGLLGPVVIRPAQIYPLTGF